MKIATIINAHNNSKLVLDTLDSVLHYMTDDVLLLIDGCCDEFDDIQLPVHKLKGFKHGCSKSPYRNVALGLQNLSSLFPDANWYCYLEYDCLITSMRFKYNLEMADDRGIWMLGSDGHVDDKSIPIVESIIGSSFHSSYYLLGACQFFNKYFIDVLNENNFFDKFLNATNNFKDGAMPGYSGYDVSEHLYPTLCRQFGGGIGVLSTWDRPKQKWHGGHKVFPIRWKPDISEDEMYPESSIFHPLKNYDHPIRKHHRNLRYVSKIKQYSDAT